MGERKSMPWVEDLGIFVRGRPGFCGKRAAGVRHGLCMGETEGEAETCARRDVTAAPRCAGRATGREGMCGVPDVDICGCIRGGRGYLNQSTCVPMLCGLIERRCPLRTVFWRWYPGMKTSEEPAQRAA